MSSNSVGVPLKYIGVSGVYVVRGKSSGQTYIFTGSGSIVPVEECDVEDFLSKRYRSGCCGSPSVDKPIFEEVTE